MATNVTLLLRGSLVLFGRVGQPLGSVRILRQPPPNHALTIQYRIQPPGGIFGDPINVNAIQDALRLDVQNPSNPNITLEDNATAIDRSRMMRLRSARWFVDFENSELYGSPVGIRPGGFKQILTFNSGNLFNDQGEDNPSYNPLLYQHGINENYIEFGFVSIRMGIEFLNAGRVIFTNGNSVVFDSADLPAGTNYKIDLVNDLTGTAQHPTVVTDANHYYKGVAAGIPPEERYLFASVVQRQFFREILREMLEEAARAGDQALLAELNNIQAEPPAGPEAACFPLYMSKTQPND
jgi:hypothetical protein